MSSEMKLSVERFEADGSTETRSGWNGYGSGADCLKKEKRASLIRRKSLDGIAAPGSGCASLQEGEPRRPKGPGAKNHFVYRIFFILVSVATFSSLR